MYAISEYFIINNKDNNFKIIDKRHTEERAEP